MMIMMGCEDPLSSTLKSGLSNFYFNTDSAESLESQEDEMEKKRRQRKVVSEKGSSANGGPDTSSFTAFLFSLLSCSEAGVRCADDHGRNDENYIEMNEPNAIPSASRGRIMGRRKQKIAMAKHYSSKTAHQGRSTSRFEAQCSGQEKGHVGSDDEGDWQLVTEHDLKSEKGLESMPQVMLPEMSEPSLLLSECLRSFLYSTLPTLAQGRTWVLLYSTWRHGVSLLTLYRRSSFCPGPCLLVAGDSQGAVFGGLLAAPLTPTNRKKYQGTNDTFVFTNVSGTPVIFRPTGANRYFVLCTADSLALGGGGHFALYLEGDLLNGSSAFSETFGNSCLAHTQDFVLKEVELWGFVYTSKYGSSMTSYSEPQEPPGICKW